jgi:hypothetical protein
LAKDPEARCGSAFELAEDLRRARAELPLAYLAGAARYPEALQVPASAARGVHPEEPASEPRRRKRPVAIGLVALAALLALLGAFGWDLTGAREGPKVAGSVTTTEGAREGGAPAAPEGFREGGSGKGVGSDMPSVELAGGLNMPASSSVSASASNTASASAPAYPASAPVSVSASPASPQTLTSKTVASEPWAPVTWGSAPSASSPAPGGSSGSGGQDAGTTSTGAVESAAQGQYR